MVALGPDADLAGKLQYALETTIDGEERTVLGAIAIGQILQTPSMEPGVNPNARRRWLRLMERATQAYFEDRMSDAQVDLSQAESLQIGVVPVEDRVRLRLTEAAVYHAINNTAQARRKIIDALTLQPGLQVSVNDYPPSFVRAVDEVRTGLRMVEVRVDGAPPDARLQIDDRPTDSEFQVPVGRHVLQSAGEGLRVQRLIFDADQPTQLRVYPALAFSDPVAARLQRAGMSAGELNSEDAELVQNLASRLNVDALVLGVVIPATEATLLVWKKDAKPKSLRVGSTRANELRELASQASDALRTRRTIMAPQAPWVVNSGASLRLGYNLRTVSGDGDAGFNSGFFGGGAHVKVEATRSLLLARADLSITTYEITPSSFNLPGGGVSRAGGGTWFFLHTGVGGVYRTDTVQLGGSLNPWIDSLSVEDLQGTSGPLGLLVGHFSFGVDFGFHAWLPVGPVTFGGDAFLTAFGVYKENPTGVTGDNPRVALSLSPRLSVVQSRGDGPWRWYATAERRVQALRFEGTATAPVTPPVTDAHVSEAAIVIAFGLQRSF